VTSIFFFFFLFFFFLFFCGVCMCQLSFFRSFIDANALVLFDGVLFRSFQDQNQQPDFYFFFLLAEFLE
jgi:hypothetical protein